MGQAATLRALLLAISGLTAAYGQQYEAISFEKASWPANGHTYYLIGNISENADGGRVLNQVTWKVAREAVSKAQALVNSSDMLILATLK